MKLQRTIRALSTFGAAFGFSIISPGVIPLIGSDAAAQTQSAPERPVVIRGNQRIEVETILSYMEIAQNQTLTPEDLNTAVRRLFDTGLFQDVQIIPRTNALIVEVVENPSINEIAFEGNVTLKDEDIDQIISLRPRFPLTRAAAEADAQSIIEVYRRVGRYGASVEPVVIERSENRVDLVFEISEGEQTRVSSISFVGNEKISDRRLRNAIDTTESGNFTWLLGGNVYDPDRFELDKELLRQYYLNRGYADFEVLSATAELTPDRENFFLTFTINEGEQYHFGTFDVQISARGLIREDFAELLPTNLEGDIYDTSRVDEIADKLGELAAEKGFAFVQVRPRSEKRTGEELEEFYIDITFEMVEGEKIFVERIDVEGNTLTLDRVIRREIELVEGDSFDARKVETARRNIRSLGFFSRVEVDPEQGSEPDRAVLKVRVDERSTGSLSFGLGYSSSAGPIGNISLSERNFLGRGQHISGTVTAAGDTQVYDLNFTEPKFLDRDLRIGARTFFIQDDRSDESSFQADRLGFSPFFGFPLGRNTELSVRYNIVQDNIATSDTTSPVIRADDGERLKSSISYRIVHDERDDPIEPSAGYIMTFDQEVAGLSGGSFVKTGASAKTWQGFFSNQVVFSFELEGGGLVSFNEESQTNDRYFLGGDRFRGFGIQGLGPRDTYGGRNDSLGGNYYAILRSQVSFPLGLPEEFGIYGGAFVDAGSLWSLDYDENILTDLYSDDMCPTAPMTLDPRSICLVSDDPILRASAGGLLFINTPFGPLELSFGIPVISEEYDDDELFRLSVGTRF